MSRSLRLLIGSLIVLWAIAGSGAAGAASSDLFFSEYIEGTSNNKALEIYNGTGAPIDLTAGGYNVQMYSNGATTASLTINLAGTVASGDVFVLAHGSAVAAILSQADQTNSGGWYNGNDAVLLRKGTTVVDSIGQVGFNPGVEWGTGLTSTADNTLRRKAGISAGDTVPGDAFDPAVEWDGFPTDTFDGLGSHSTTGGPAPDTAPSVTGTSPANGAIGVPTNATVTVDFSEPVTVVNPWYTLSCATSGSHTATVSGGPSSYTLTPTTPFANGESCTFTVLASGVHDVDTNDPPDTMSANFVVGYSTVAENPCTAAITPIPAIQGSGASAAVTGSVRTRGVVVADYEGASPMLRGFYLQDPAGDGNSATSDGIFVFEGSNADTVDLGDLVTVAGNASENQGQTQISVGTITKCGTGTVTPTDVTLPADATALEAVEGMLVRMPQTLSVTEHFQLGRFGQVVLSSGGRLYQPTAVVDPGAPAAAMQAANDLNKLILDDGTQAQNPPTLFGRGGNPLTASNTLRGGDTLTGAVGVMTYTWAGNIASGNAYRLRTIGALGGGAPSFFAANARPTSAPAVGGTLRVVGMNLLNFFNTYGNGACLGGTTGTATDCRGADNAAEFDRQWPKTVAAMIGTGGDIVGIAEIENDGYGASSAIQFLVDKLNAATAPGTYAFIDADARSGQVDALGSDAIKVGVIYKPGKVTPIGTTAVLNSVAFVNGGSSSPRNRVALAQAFRENATGATLVVSPNHLKSKGGAAGDPNKDDGQGYWADVRTNAANLLADWLNGDPTGTGTKNALIVGDLNSYAKEDPIAALEAKGFTNLAAAKIGPEAYSYVFDGQWGYLDYAMASSGILPSVTGVAEWHINADEPSVLDYNTNFKSTGQQASLYAPDEFRVSDHDPVVVGLDLNAPPTASAGGPYTVAEGGSVTLTASGTDESPSTLAYAWDLDNDGTYETAGQSATFSAATIDGPATRTVKVRVTDAGGLTAVDSATVTVTNVAPTATFNAPATALAGVPFTISLTNASDAAPADVAGLTYAFDCGSGYGTFTTANSASCTSLAVGPLAVGGKVRDDDGGVREYRGTVTVGVTYASLCDLTRAYVANAGIANALCAKLEAAARADARGKEKDLHNYVNQLEAQSGKAISAADAATLIRLAASL